MSAYHRISGKSIIFWELLGFQGSGLKQDVYSVDQMKDPNEVLQGRLEIKVTILSLYLF